MKYKITLNGKTYEVEVEEGQAMLVDEYEAYAPAPAPASAGDVPCAVYSLPWRYSFFSMFSPYSTHFATQTQAFCKNNPDFAPECALTSRPHCITIKA